MIALASLVAQACAPARLNQMGRVSETASSWPLGTTLHPVETRLGAMPKLPLRNCARARLATLQSDWVANAGESARNWKFINLANALFWPASLGAESHPLQGWGRTLAERVLPTHPWGFARAACRHSPQRHPK